MIAAPEPLSPTPTTAPRIVPPKRTTALVTPIRPATAEVTPTAAERAAVHPVLAALDSLPVKGRAPKTGYTRAKFGDAWTDDVTVDGGHNGCDTRNDVLRRDLMLIRIKVGTNGCVVAAGSLRDPYTGRLIAFVRGETTSDLVQIDHVVALSNAWQTGAQALPEATRRDLANDPLELLAVDGAQNEAKSDGDAATWLPPAKPFRCEYVTRQIAVKVKYSLWVTPPEKAAMAAILAGCPGEQMPATSRVDVPAPVAD